MRTISGVGSGRLSRRQLLQVGAAGFVDASMSALRGASAAPVTIRYATGGGIGPNEMETIIYLDYLKENVLKNYGKSYTLEMTFTRGTPEAATLLASGQADLGTLAFSTFATAIAKNAVAGGLSIISDNYQDGHAGKRDQYVFRASRLADQGGRRSQGQEDRYQCLWFCGRSCPSRRLEEERPRSAT